MTFALSLASMASFIDPCRPSQHPLHISSVHRDWQSSLQVAVLLPCSTHAAQIDAIVSTKNRRWTSYAANSQSPDCRTEEKFRNRRFQTVAIDGELLNAMRSHGLEEENDVWTLRLSGRAPKNTRRALERDVFARVDVVSG